MADIRLTEDLKAFAERCVASGRYGDVNEVVRAGLRLLQRQEEVEAFRQSLEDSLRRGEMEGFTTVEEMEAEMDAIIDRAEADLAARAAS